ncbi:MAG: aminoglycoside phosphotransferase family protein [Myxococcales bacterium]|nr:aminoglycoside phosphotransferase family protein [Myxococcales bacterium]
MPGPPTIDTALVTRLIHEQLPHWGDLEIRPVERQGHDNRTFRLGDAMGVRLPSAAHYAAHVEIEHTWLPRLASGLPLPIPAPLAIGRPSHAYPWPWTVNRWIAGRPTGADRVADLTGLARDLAGFLNALRAIDATGAPAPGAHNFFRGGELAVYDGETRACIDALRGQLDAAAALDVWESALEARHRAAPVWVHGDVAPDNLLVDDGSLCAVIDFGQLAAGDPACDLTIAWTLFSGPSRDIFRHELHADRATWLRARGWALWKALLMLRSGSTPPSQRAPHQVISELVEAD